MSRLSRHRKNLFDEDTPGLFDFIDSDTLPELPEDAIRRPDTLRFISFGSGSSGNSSYIGTDTSGLLIDAGVDNNYICESLERNAIDIRNIKGILITHDHGDHIRYAYALLRRNPHMRLFATPRTLNGILRRHNISRRISDYHTPIYKEFPFKAGDITVTAFETSHDGTDNCGFFIEGAGTTFVIATDTGIITERADFYIRQAAHLMIEANYDAEMLRKGPYTPRLKARIASDTGHLDNVVGAAYVSGIYRGTLRNIFLCHLSQDNNTPEIARKVFSTAFRVRGIVVGDGSGSPDDREAPLSLHVLPRLEASQLMILR